MKTPLKVRVGQLRIGQTRSFGPNGEPSAIVKRTVDRGHARMQAADRVDAEMLGMK